MSSVSTETPAYVRHALHGEDRTWTETNCYTDLLIELVHSMGHDPVAMLPFTLAIDFEGDQWTFFKPAHFDLLSLYGLDVQELAIWKAPIEHVAEQVAADHPVLIEVDSFWLPDTSGTAYRTIHQKTTIGVTEIDVERGSMAYFHNQGFYTVAGEDFARLFHFPSLPPYAEFVKRPSGFAPLMAADIELFHKYSFATLRQYGACFELAETYLGWLGTKGVAGLEVPRSAFASIAQTAKAFQFQLARSMSRRKPLDMGPLDTMGAQWEVGMTLLQSRYA
jgi:hypothetical protein